MTITALYTIHAVDVDKKNDVIKEMRVMGSPTIRVVDCGDYYMALEGVHRIAAAAELNLPLDLDILEQDDLIDASTLDWQDLQDETYTAGELAGEAYSNGCGIYRLHSNDTVTEA
jgi:hypothetical protein